MLLAVVLVHAIQLPIQDADLLLQVHDLLLQIVLLINVCNLFDSQSIELLPLRLGVAMEDPPLLHRLINLYAEVRLLLRPGLFQLQNLELLGLNLLRARHCHRLVVFNGIILCPARVGFLQLLSQFALRLLMLILCIRILHDPRLQSFICSSIK